MRVAAGHAAAAAGAPWRKPTYSRRAVFAAGPRPRPPACPAATRITPYRYWPPTALIMFV